MKWFKEREKIEKEALETLVGEMKEQLLELYRELMTVKDMIIFFSFNRSYDENTEEIERDLEVQIDELEKQIKELENEIR